jgi:hypothetical protein
LIIPEVEFELILRYFGRMRLNFAVFAQEARTMPEGGLEIFNPITDLFAKGFPAVHAESAVVVNFCPEDVAEHELKVTVTGGYKKECITPYVTKIPAAQAPDHSVGHIVSLRDIPLEQEGTYKMEIRVDDEILATLPFTARRIMSEPCPPPAGCEAK